VHEGVTTAIPPSSIGGGGVVIPESSVVVVVPPPPRPSGRVRSLPQPLETRARERIREARIEALSYRIM
jgi:hypothetical protein